MNSIQYPHFDKTKQRRPIKVKDICDNHQDQKKKKPKKKSTQNNSNGVDSLIDKTDLKNAQKNLTSFLFFIFYSKNTNQIKEFMEVNLRPGQPLRPQSTKNTIKIIKKKKKKKKDGEQKCIQRRKRREVLNNDDQCARECG